MSSNKRTKDPKLGAPSSLSPKTMIRLKLFIDIKTNKVLFAEADKAAVDFIFQIPSLSMSAVVEFLKNEHTVGSLANLYDSIENLCQTKDSLLKPKTLNHEPCSNLLLSALPPTPKPNPYVYSCKTPCCQLYFSHEPGNKCLSCGDVMNFKAMDVALSEVKWEGKEGGFVKETMKYMVMDDLKVKPLSTVDILKALNGSEAETLEKKVVDLGTVAASKLLKSVLESKTVLSDVFLEIESKRKYFMLHEQLALQCYTHYYVNVEEEYLKHEILFDLYDSGAVAQISSVVFVNSRRKVDWLANKMRSRGYTVSATHGGMDQKTRNTIMRQFCSSFPGVLITTDEFIDRGVFLGSQEISYVINYDLPSRPEDYLRRICPGGLYRWKSIAINFVTEDESSVLDDDGMLFDMLKLCKAQIVELPAKIGEDLGFF